ncbi:MAG: hypothetical protein AAGC65_16625 [Mucilaginibacter sp.]|uniref:hypothetical protein n=1 Tax=Mucilaginibacter sp. TaxID=1882438 RepID=UPI0031AE6EAF
MFTTIRKTIKASIFILLGVITIIYTSCNSASSNSNKHNKELISFKSIQGIGYTEVQRLQRNGLAINEYGYQLEPQWQINFVSDDSASVYSPIKKRFLNFPLTRGSDSIFNAARAWLKVKKMNKDSLILEILKAKNDSIEVNGSKVYMTFYADDYIKNVLHSDTGILRRPSRRDTLFVKGIVAKANKDITKAFAARQVVTFQSRSPQVSVNQERTVPNELNNFDTADDYLGPTFDITINKAYKEFYYSFSVCVDDKGQMHYVKPLIGFTEEDYKQSYIRLSKQIMETYLKYYLNVKPGTTLSMPHASVISLHVEGKVAAAETAKK